MDPEELAQAAEEATAAIGIKAILEGRPKLPASPPNLPKEMRKLILAFLAKPGRAPLENLPAFDYDEAAKLLDDTGSEAQTAKLRAAIPAPALADAVVDKATVIISKLHESLPRFTRVGVAGTVSTRGSDMAVDRYRRKWSIAMDPLIVLRDLCDGSLSQDMVGTFADFWPALYSAAKLMVLDGVAEMKTKRPTWDLEPRRERLLLKFMGEPPTNIELARDFQKLYAQVGAQKAQEAAAPALSKLDMGDSLATPGQAQ